ncbi:Putative adenine deaminase (plasmid) [Borrelia hermsii YBT]|uniref:Putative adenine deaminase n=1 Tax=Borrelia hermsii YBT TaxID=1313295 RepID=W5T0Q9_BORHE|nr:Putative adenine deaminase [Borrelia hermsii YBT]
MKILIREGSITKNFVTLRPIISECSGKYRDYLMFCFDNAHPNILFNRHINLMIASAIEHSHVWLMF